MFLSVYLDMVLITYDFIYRTFSSYPVFEAFYELLHIAVRTTFDDIPLWPIVDTEQAMVQEKLEKEPGREAEHILWISRPDGCAHWNNVFIDEYFTVVAIV